MSTCYTSAACAACSSDLGHRASQPSAERGRQYVGIYTAFGDDLSERGRRDVGPRERADAGGGVEQQKDRRVTQGDHHA